MNKKIAILLVVCFVQLSGGKKHRQVNPSSATPLSALKDQLDEARKSLDHKDHVISTHQQQINQLNDQRQKAEDLLRSSDREMDRFLAKVREEHQQTLAELQQELNRAHALLSLEHAQLEEKNKEQAQLVEIIEAEKNLNARLMADNSCATHADGHYVIVTKKELEQKIEQIVAEKTLILTQENTECKNQLLLLETEAYGNTLNNKKPQIKTKDDAEIFDITTRAEMQRANALHIETQASHHAQILNLQQEFNCSLIRKNEAERNLLQAQYDREKQGFWEYIKRPEVAVSALSTAMVTAPLIIKIFRDIRSNKGVFLSQKEMLQLQKQKLENQKVTIEVAAAEDNLMRQVIEREKEAIELAAQKRKLKASALLTDLAAQEADGKPLTQAQLAKKQRCIEELEMIKSVHLNQLQASNSHNKKTHMVAPAA